MLAKRAGVAAGTASAPALKALQAMAAIATRQVDAPPVRSDTIVARLTSGDAGRIEAIGADFAFGTSWQIVRSQQA